MKRTVAVMLVVGTLALTGCASIQHASMPESQKAAIESVFAQRARIVAGDRKTSLLSSQRVAEMMAVVVQNCPADFRSAWFDYLVEFQLFYTRRERVAGIASAMGKPVTDLSSLVKFAGTSPGLGQYLLAALSRVDDAWGKLERTAMNYDVMPKIDVGEAEHRPDSAPEPPATAP